MAACRHTHINYHNLTITKSITFAEFVFTNPINN